MIKDWIGHEDQIRDLKRGIRKNRTPGPKEPELEKRLVIEFEVARAAGRSINRRWFIRKALSIYENIYPHRVSREGGKRAIYTGFTASIGWFQAFRKRTGMALHQPTKKAQCVRDSIF